MGANGLRWDARGPEHSLTPLAPWYFDDERYRLELDRIFFRLWNCVGEVGAVARPGDYFTADIAGEPIVVVRDKDGQLRAFSNVCRHRAGPVAQGKGNRRSFVCGYHGWCYDLDGTLLAAREMKRHQEFDPANVRLPEFPVAAWGPLVFVSLAQDVPPLEEWLGPLPDFVEPWRLHELELVSCKEWLIECNWKVFGENYCEGYHLPFVHPGFTETIGLKEYTTEIYSAVISEQTAPEGHPRGPGARVAKAFGCTTAELRTLLPPLPSLDRDKRERYFFYFIFPNMALNLGPDGMSVIRLNPVTPEQSAISYWSWFAAGTSAKDVLRNALLIVSGHQIQDEDKQIVEAVQPRLHSRAYESGPYAPDWERAVYHFTDLVSIFGEAETARAGLEAARARYERGAGEPSAAAATPPGR